MILARNKKDDGECSSSSGSVNGCGRASVMERMEVVCVYVGELLQE